jgi:hypothetical protein
MSLQDAIGFIKGKPSGLLLLSQSATHLVMCDARLIRRTAMPQLMPLVVVTALALVSSTIVAEAQSRGGGSTSTSIGAITAPQLSTTRPSLPAGSLRTIGVIAAPPSSATTSPSSVIARPLNQLNLGNTPLNQGAGFLATPVGPLPPVPTTVTTQTSGGSSGIQLQGGGRDTLEGCIGFWDRATHMTKTEWKAACQRSIVHREEIMKFYQKSIGRP